MRKIHSAETTSVSLYALCRNAVKEKRDDDAESYFTHVWNKSMISIHSNIFYDPLYFLFFFGHIPFSALFISLCLCQIPFDNTNYEWMMYACMCVCKLQVTITFFGSYIFASLLVKNDKNSFHFRRKIIL